MSYSKKQFGQGLLDQINNGFDVIRISKWAFHEYFNNTRKISKSLKDVIMDVVTMEEGPEFEYTEKELRKLASDLLKSED